MGTALSDLQAVCASKCCEPTSRNNEYVIAAQQQMLITTHNLTRSRHSIDSIEATEIESSNVDYINATINDDYTHKPPSPWTPSHEVTPRTDINFNAMEFVDESIDGQSVSLMSEKITTYDISNTPMTPSQPIINTPKTNNNNGIRMDLNELIDNNWTYRELMALISFIEKNNGIWDNLSFDEILSLRHNNVTQCIAKYQQLIEYKHKYHQQKAFNLKDIAVYESHPKIVHYVDEATQIWEDAQHKKKMLLKRESSKLVLTKKAFKSMSEDTLIFFLQGSKKSLHLSQMDSNGTKMRGYIVGTQMINKTLPTQINNDIKRVYYINPIGEYMLNISQINGNNLGIFAYNLDTFQYELLAKFPPFNQHINDMYFSLYYDEINQQFHVLCGPTTGDNNADIWCIYDIENKQCDVDMVSLNVNNKAPIIMVCDGDRFIFNGDIFMHFDENIGEFVRFNVANNYKYKSMNDMLSCFNMIYVINEKRIYLFGGYSNVSLVTDIWYIDMEAYDGYEWKKYVLLNKVDTFNFIKYKSMQCLLCFESMILIFIQSEKRTMNGINDNVDIGSNGKVDDGELHYDVVYCLDLKQKKMSKASYNLVGVGGDIIMTQDNVVHCITNKCHFKVNAFELIPEHICDFYKKQNTDLVIGYLRMYCNELKEPLSVDTKKIIYNYLPIL